MLPEKYRFCGTNVCCKIDIRAAVVVLSTFSYDSQMDLLPQKQRQYGFVSGHDPAPSFLEFFSRMLELGMDGARTQKNSFLKKFLAARHPRAARAIFSIVFFEFKKCYLWKMTIFGEIAEFVYGGAQLRYFMSTRQHCKSPAKKLGARVILRAHL